MLNILSFYYSLPLLVFTKDIFDLWLSSYPQYTILFTRIIIITTLVDSLSYPLMATFQATGRVKKYQIIVGGIILFNVPISYLVFKYTTLDASACLWIVFSVSLICLLVRLILLQQLLNMAIVKLFFLRVIIPIISVGSIMLLASYMVKTYYISSYSYILISLSILMAVYIALLYCIGLSAEEKSFLKKAFEKLKNKVK